MDPWRLGHQSDRTMAVCARVCRFGAANGAFHVLLRVRCDMGPASSASSRTSRQPTSRSRSVHSRWLAVGGVDGSAAWHSFGDGSPRGRCRVRPRGPPSPSTPTLFQAAAIDVTCAWICDGMSDRACVCVCVYEHEHGHARRRSRRRGRRRMHRRRRRRSRRRSRRRGRRSYDVSGGGDGQYVASAAIQAAWAALT